MNRQPRAHFGPGFLLSWIALAASCGMAREQETKITIQPGRVKQVFQGLGCGAIFYEGHITSLAARLHEKLQEQLYDDFFARVPTRYLQLMIRETHEPANDNADPWKQDFKEKDFAYCEHTLAIAKAALKRRKDIELFATLYTPPPWMKTNNDASGGGEARATLKPGMELEFAEYAWAFLAHMQKNGAPIQYLSIANEPDFPHTQPGCCFTPEKYAVLFKTVGEYLEKMAKQHPEVPRPKMVGPNTLSAPAAAKDYVPPLMRNAARYLEVFASHDYDVRGDRWGTLRRLAGERPVWATEWCARKKDSSAGMINSATEYGQAMHEAFKGGANVWMAYDWAYPPRDSGEALAFIEWGKEYKLTKAYHLFRQWAEPLVPGMRVVESSIAGQSAGADEGKPGVKPTAFLSADERTLVVHVVNTRDQEAPISLKLTDKWAGVASAERVRTSAEEDAVALPALKAAGAGFSDTLPGRSMVTYRFGGGK